MNQITGRARVLDVLRGESPSGRPVWLLRQAGRYLPEYRALRRAASFLELVRSPGLCTEAALQPLRRFDLDATIVFSDILVIPDALGAGLTFTPGDGPKIERPVLSDAAFSALEWAGACDRLTYVYDAVTELRKEAPHHALYGFAGAPWTLFCYLVQGEGGKDFAVARRALWQHPERSAALLLSLGDVAGQHLRRQHRAGADVVQVFDTWAGLLPAEDYAALVYPSLRRMAEHLRGIPWVMYARGGGRHAGAFREMGASAVGVDATDDLANIRGVATQGNLDSTRLLAGNDAAGLDALQRGVRRIHDALGGRTNHIYNLGQGLLPETPPEAVAAFVEAVRALP